MVSQNKINENFIIKVKAQLISDKQREKVTIL